MCALRTNKRRSKNFLPVAAIDNKLDGALNQCGESCCCFCPLFNQQISGCCISGLDKQLISPITQPLRPEVISLALRQVCLTIVIAFSFKVTLAIKPAELPMHHEKYCMQICKGLFIIDVIFFLRIALFIPLI